jgi:hypothetical protein
MLISCSDHGVKGPTASRICSFLESQLPFLEHVHDLDPDQGVLGCGKRLEAEHGVGDPLDCAMVLLYEVVEIFHLPDDDGPVLLVVALNGGFIGRTAINRKRFGETVPADGLRTLMSMISCGK